MNEWRPVVPLCRDHIIRTRFMGIDKDRHGAIGLAEFQAWQTRMGSSPIREQAFWTIKAGQWRTQSCHNLATIRR